MRFVATGVHCAGGARFVVCIKIEPEGIAGQLTPLRVGTKLVITIPVILFVRRKVVNPDDVNVSVGGGVTAMLAENSEVLLPLSVVVAAMNCPGRAPPERVAEKLARPPELMVTVVDPMQAKPSPNPETFVTSFT